MSMTAPLSEVKTRLSEFIRTVRRTGESIVVTVDGEPAACIVPIEDGARTLTPAEIATERALLDAIARIAWAPDPFDAVALVQEARR
jgi:prevent-host-death family protein